MENVRSDLLILSICRKAAERITGHNHGPLVERTTEELHGEVMARLDELYARGMRDWQAQMSVPVA